MNYKYDSAHEWLLDYLTRNPNQAHSVAMSLAMKLDADTIQDEFQSHMDADGYFEDLDAQPDESENSEQGSTLTPVVAILTIFVMAALLIAQSGIVNALVARFAQVIR